MLGRAVLSFGMLIAPLCADWKITKLNTYDHGRSIETSYFKNGLERSDTIDPSTGEARSVWVLDRPGMRRIAWDPPKREYSIQRFRAAQAVKEFGPVAVFDVESTDTGERRTMFSREVRRVITVERRHSDGGPIESESRTDGWYLESDSLPPGLGSRKAFLFSAVDAHARPLIKINQHGLVEKGLPVSTITTTVHTILDGGDERQQSSSEVTELYEGPLDTGVFEPPASFRRVFNNCFARTWSDKLACVEDWLSALVP